MVLLIPVGAKIYLEHGLARLLVLALVAVPVVIADLLRHSVKFGTAAPVIMNTEASVQAIMPYISKG